MAREKFFGALDAAEYASQFCEEWKLEDGRICNKKDFCDWMDFLDGEAPMDEDDDERYYFVDEFGAVGIADEVADSVYWVATPTQPRAAAPVSSAAAPAQFCANCGSRVDASWKFCQKCGYKLQ